MNHRTEVLTVASRLGWLTNLGELDILDVQYTASTAISLNWFSIPTK
jgi:hypothetical protein